MDKQFFVNVVNLKTGKIFSLPTLYTDRTEACICGQNYCRDRQVEDPSCIGLFFRVLVAKDGKVAEPSYFTIVDDEDDDDEPCPHPEQECCEDCPFYSECWEFDNEDNEEPEHDESVYGDTEEPSSESLAEILSVFNAIRPNY